MVEIKLNNNKVFGLDNYNHIPNIATTEMNIDRLQENLLIIKGKYYHWAMIDRTNTIIFVNEIDIKDLEEIKNETIACCPYCGEEIDTCDFSDDEIEIDCSCGAEIEVYRQISVTYDCRVKKKPTILEVK